MPSPSQQIDKVAASLTGWQAKEYSRLRDLINDADEDIDEDWKWDTAVWTKKGNVVALGVFKEHLKLNFFKGASYIRWDIAKDERDPGFPATISAFWPGLFTSKVGDREGAPWQTQDLMNQVWVIRDTPGASGEVHFSMKAIMQNRGGIADALKPKLTFRNALDGGVSAVSKGEAEIGLFPLSEVLHDDGVTVVGPIPPEVQLNNIYGTAVLSANEAPEPAMAFVKFLTDPANAKHWKDGGFGPANMR